VGVRTLALKLWYQALATKLWPPSWRARRPCRGFPVGGRSRLPS